MNNNMEFLVSAKLTSKNQITIPKMVREKLDVKDGDSLLFFIDNNEVKLSNRKNCKVEIEDKERQVGIEKGEQ